ncbi:MAG: quinolinate synthase NadA [Bdellovibrionales bacterium]|nr:quinolinate synthase NadA [Bdellovibrionales bacterium]
MIQTEINELKKEKDAVILAHFYETGDIQDIADHVGDSLYLAQVSQKLPHKVILLAGVYFMGESVKILSPEKTVLVPDTKAGCSLVDHSPFDQYLKWRLENPKGISMTYVNSSAAVKGISDVICTSSNAETIVKSIPEDREILFGPDENLGKYLAKKLNRKMKFWPGSCEVHVLFSAKKLFLLKEKNPDALVLAHPECMDSVLQYADIIGSTSRLIKEVKENKSTQKFIVATETGIFHQMKKENPEAILLQAPFESSCACNDCPYMKLNTLEKIRDALKSLEPQIHLSAKTIKHAKIPLDRMMKITAGHAVEWPEKFTYRPATN